jgi:hypothetical protein
MFERMGEEKTVHAKLIADPSVSTEINSDSESDATDRRNAWLETQ